MKDGAGELEWLLRRALAPVDPPDGLAERLEARLVAIAELAAEELEGWELRAMRDPRKWLRPAAAAVAGASAGSALVLLRARRHQRREQLRGPRALVGLARRAAGGLADEARRLAPMGDEPVPAWPPPHRRRTRASR